MGFELSNLTDSLLDKLSYESKLGKSLKNTIRKFNKDDIVNEILDIKEFYESTEYLKDVNFSYRIKSLQSCVLKYDKYFPSVEMNKCYNDLLGIRIIVANYEELLNQNLDIFKIADMRNGKKNDDGYRGIHLYYQKTNKHYPIEIQINSKYDRKLNDWLHIYLYKHTKDNSIGSILRKKYDNNEIKSEDEFKEVLKSVLYSRKEI